MAVTLRCCPLTWMRLSGHPCERVRRALDEAGIDYDVVKEPFRKSRRTDLVRLTGQLKMPAIEFDDGSALREESADMAARIRAGRLFER